jgi:hypothetical protein
VFGKGQIKRWTEHFFINGQARASTNNEVHAQILAPGSWQKVVQISAITKDNRQLLLTLVHQGS